MKSLLLISFIISSIVVAGQSKPFTADKQLHFAAGFTIGGATAMAFKTPKQSFRNGLLAGTLAGFMKEGYDAVHGGDVEVLDIIATTAGAAVGSFVISKVKTYVYLHRKAKKRDVKAFIQNKTSY